MGLNKCTLYACFCKEKFSNILWAEHLDANSNAISLSSNSNHELDVYRNAQRSLYEKYICNRALHLNAASHTPEWKVTVRFFPDQEKRHLWRADAEKLNSCVRSLRVKFPNFLSSTSRAGERHRWQNVGPKQLLSLLLLNLRVYFRRNELVCAI